MGGKGEQIKDLTVACLEKNKVETAFLDLYVNITQQVTLSVSGPTCAELHLTGYFEPQRETDEEAMFMDGEEEEEEDEIDEDEEEPSK
jgi:hypothetical protein